MSAIGALLLTDVRDRAATALAPALEGDPDVQTGLVDAVEPPALILNYEDPWIQPMTACLLECRLEIICVGSRVEPGAGLEALEALVTYAITRMSDDVHSWALQTVQAPRVFTIGGVPLLGARIAYAIRISV